MTRVELPSLAEQLDQLPLRWSESTVNRGRPQPQPGEFLNTPPRRKRKVARNNREYMRLYMRARREQRRAAV